MMFFFLGMMCVCMFLDRNRSRNYANRYSCSFSEVYFVIDRKKTWIDEFSWCEKSGKNGKMGSNHRDSKVPCYLGILWDWVVVSNMFLFSPPIWGRFRF